MRVTEMTNYFSSSPTFTYTSLPVAPYQGAGSANQPGGTWTTFPNTTTTEVMQAANGELVTGMSSATAADGFTYDKGLYYVVNISGGTPTLVKQGVVDPGPGVSVEMFSAAMDSRGNLGFTWMQGSSTQYVSMYVGSLDTQGHFSSYDATPNAGFFYENFRIGDYSTVVIDPTDGNTFWAANEYSGPDAASDIWSTHITSFSLPPAINNDWYTINIGAGNTVTLQSYTPSTQGGQYPNADPVLSIQLYDTFGNLVATGTQNADGHNSTLTYKATIGGQYHVLVSNTPGTSGEYFLQVNTSAYAAGGVSGQVINDINGNGKLTGDPGLDNWEVDLYTSGGTKVASQMTHFGGNYDFEGLVPGSYTIKEVLQSGWTQTVPASPGSIVATVTAGKVISGLNFGDFQNITIAGLAYNDLNGDGAQESGEPGLSGWTIQLVNSAGKVVASQVTGSGGAYSFANVGPGTYTVKEVLQSGWVQTSTPTNFTVAATSGQNVGGLAFGDFKLVTYSGTVYNDLNGNGVMDPGEKALSKWTINLLNSNGTVVASVTTNGTGTYSFANLGPGKWTIQEVNQSGWYQTQPVNPPGTYVFAAVSGTNQTGLNYGNFQEITLSGSVYNDLNGDGKRQGKEPGLANWTVDLLNSSGNVVASATTDSNGNYTIGQVFPGTFSLVEVLQSGWVQTQPVNPPAYTITPKSGQNQSGLVFGVHKTTASSQKATIGLSSIAAQGTTNGPIAALDTSSTTTASSGSSTTSPATASTTRTAPSPTSTAAPTVSLIGTNSTPVRVLYNQGTQPAPNAPVAPLVDVALGVVSGRVQARQTVVTEQAIGALAGALLDEDNES
jgi:protocatechuate 3,4-dioxygenase beta subunit